MNLTGFKTIIVGAGIAVLPSLLSHLATVDWTAIGVSSPVAFAISGVVMVAMRYVTSTPVAKPNAVSAVAAMPDEELRKAGIVEILTAPTPTGVGLAKLTPGDVVQSMGDLIKINKE